MRNVEQYVHQLDSCVRCVAAEAADRDFCTKTSNGRLAKTDGRRHVHARSTSRRLWSTARQRTGGSWPSATSPSWCNGSRTRPSRAADACRPAEPSTNCCCRSRESCGRSRSRAWRSSVAMPQRERISNATTHDCHWVAIPRSITATNHPHIN